MLSEYLVCDVHELLKRPVLLCGAAVFVRFKSPAVDAVGVIENYMKVRVVFVDVAGHEILIFAFQKLLTYSFWCKPLFLFFCAGFQGRQPSDKRCELWVAVSAPTICRACDLC